MKLLVYILIIVQICSFPANYSLVYNNTDSILSNTDKNYNQPIKEDVGSLTLAVNAINNIMAWTSALIGIITLIVAFFGYFGYNKVENRIKGKILELDEKQKKFDTYILKMKEIEAKIISQEKYTFNSNLYIYDTLDKIANQITDSKKGNVILETLLHSYQITNLYTSEVDLKFAALAYIQSNGVFDDIKHLEHVATYDPDVKNQIWAREIIGVIKHKKSG